MSIEIKNNDRVNQKTDYSTAEKTIHAASQWKLIWWRFCKHKMAITAAVILIILYFLAIFSSFISPHDPHQRSLSYRQAPPQKIHFIDHNGNFYFRPFVYPLKGKVDMETLEKTYTEVTEKPTAIRFFVRGFKYKLLGLFSTDIHLFGTGKDNIPIHLFGTDELGRDLFSRVFYGSRISLSIGLIGVLISFFLGILIGGIGGYYGGKVDMLIQRIIELLRSIPHLPLWMGLSAAVPTDWPPLRTYFAITIILSILGWTGLARVVRGKFLALREEDFIVAAELAGRNQLEIIFIHMLPSFISHIIASLTLAIPAMILGETALSFLGIGLRPPVISWGVLLMKAQNVQTVAMAPWLMIPGIFVIITVLAFNFLGDGLRDAADPYS